MESSLIPVGIKNAPRYSFLNDFEIATNAKTVARNAAEATTKKKAFGMMGTAIGVMQLSPRIAKVRKV